MYYISSFLFIPNGLRVLPLSMRYASLAFRALSLLDLMSPSGISVVSLAEWSLVKKCSQTVAGLELLDGLSTGLQCSLKRSLSRCLVSHIVWSSGCNVSCKWRFWSDRSGFACRVECVWSLSVRYVFARETVFSAWVWAPGLVMLCEIAKFGLN